MTEARQAMLAAGVRLYGSLAEVLLRELTAGKVAAEAGFHRQTFYRYWDAQAAYVEDLVNWLLDPARGPAADGAAVIPERRPPEDLETFVHEVAEHDLTRLLDDETVRLRLGLLTMDVLDDPKYAARSQAYYEASVGSLTRTYDHLLAGWGLEPTDGVTTRDLVRILQAQLVGFAILHRAVEDEPPVGVLFERVAVAVLRSGTRPVTAPPDEAAAPEPSADPRGEDDAVPADLPGPDGATRRALLEAGARLYSRLASDLLHGLTASRVAEAAGYHRQTFYHQWSTQASYVTSLLRWLLAPAQQPGASAAEVFSPEGRSGPEDIAAFARDLAVLDLARIRADPKVQMRVGLTTVGALESAPLKTLVQAHYDSSTDRLCQAYDALLAGWGREPVDGVTVRDLARVLHAQLVGFAIALKGAQDSRPVAELMERCALATLTELTRPTA